MTYAKRSDTLPTSMELSADISSPLFLVVHVHEVMSLSPDIPLDTLKCEPLEGRDFVSVTPASSMVPDILSVLNKYWLNDE